MHTKGRSEHGVCHRERRPQELFETRRAVHVDSLPPTRPTVSLDTSLKVHDRASVTAQDVRQQARQSNDVVRVEVGNEYLLYRGELDSRLQEVSDCR